MEIFSIITLSLSGLLLSMVGIMRLSNPTKNYAKNSGIQLPQDTNLLNEMRGVSAVMLMGGIIMLLGTFTSSLTPTSHIVAILILLGFATGRTISITTDGKPNKQIIQGLFTEIVLGTANIVCIIQLWV